MFWFSMMFWDLLANIVLPTPTFLKFEKMETEEQRLLNETLDYKRRRKKLDKRNLGALLMFLPMSFMALTNTVQLPNGFFHGTPSVPGIPFRDVAATAVEPIVAFGY
jgi:hypothetical protein